MDKSKLQMLDVQSITDPSFNKVARYIEPPPFTPGESKFYPAYFGFNIGSGSDVDISWLYVAPQPYRPKRGFDRHLYTEEVFIAVEGDFYFPAAPCRNPDDPEDEPRPEDFGLWRINEGDMFALKPNVWHDGCWPVDPEQTVKFIMILSGHRTSEGGEHIDYIRRSFPGEDEFIMIDTSFLIDLD